MKRTYFPTPLLSLSLAVVALLVVGCGDSAEDDADTGTYDATALPTGLFLSEAPEGAADIKTLKTTAKEGDKVVVRAVVGGQEAPIVEGKASAFIIDASLENLCVSEDDHCETPWDYCCAADKKEHLATLQVVNDKGQVVSADLTKHFKPLTTLVVTGVVGPRASDETLVINATGIYVESTTKK